MARKEKTELEIARQHYRMWLEAEEEIALDQAYSIGSQSLMRADLGKVAQRIEYWRNRVAALEKLENGKGRSRIYKIIPFPRGRDRGYTWEYFRGLTAEHRILTYKKGVPVYEWRIKDAAHKRNEALDVRNYATAALEISNVTLKNRTAPGPQLRNGGRAGGGVHQEG